MHQEIRFWSGNIYVTGSRSVFRIIINKIIGLAEKKTVFISGYSTLRIFISRQKTNPNLLMVLESQIEYWRTLFSNIKTTMNPDYLPGKESDPDHSIQLIRGHEKLRGNHYYWPIYQGIIPFLVLIPCPHVLHKNADQINPNSIGVKYSLIVFGGAVYTKSRFWPPYWSKIHFSWQRQYQTEKLMLLENGHFFLRPFDPCPKPLVNSAPSPPQNRSSCILIIRYNSTLYTNLQQTFRKSHLLATTTIGPYVRYSKLFGF